MTDKLKVSDRVERLCNNPAFITLKDHKNSFHMNLHAGCQTFLKANWKKSEKNLDKVNKELTEKLKTLINGKTPTV